MEGNSASGIFIKERHRKTILLRFFFDNPSAGEVARFGERYFEADGKNFHQFLIGKAGAAALIQRKDIGIGAIHVAARLPDGKLCRERQAQLAQFLADDRARVSH